VKLAGFQEEGVVGVDLKNKLRETYCKRYKSIKKQLYDRYYLLYIDYRY